MKTVIDAVNENGSVWFYKDSASAYYRTNGTKGYWYYGESKPSNNEHVCTLQEFNKCIDMLIGDPLKLIIWKESQNINLKVKPVTSPIYTQEMADNGELPSVGMECLFKHHNKMIPGRVVAVTDKFIILLGDDGNERIRIIAEFIVGPITPPKTDEEKAIDEACFIVDDSKRCIDTNINIDCSAAQKAVIITLIKNGWAKK